MIQFSHLTKRFGKFTAVDDLSFSVEPQQALALLEQGAAYYRELGHPDAERMEAYVEEIRQKPL